MAMTRRRFGQAAVLAVTTVLTGTWSTLRAWRARRFPGRVEPLEERQWKKPGPWAG